MKVPEVMQVKTIEYLKELERTQKIIDELQHNNVILFNDCERYKKVLNYILGLEPININGKLYISLEDIIKICEAGLKKREK